MHITRILPLCWKNSESNKMGINDAKQILNKMQVLATKIGSEKNGKSKRRLVENLSSLTKQFKKTVEKLPS